MWMAACGCCVALRHDAEQMECSSTSSTLGAERAGEPARVVGISSIGASDTHRGGRSGPRPNTRHRAAGAGRGLAPAQGKRA